MTCCRCDVLAGMTCRSTDVRVDADPYAIFACAVAGAKLVVVMGHTACGAIKGAIDNAQLGSLTGLLSKIKPAVEATRYEGDRTSKNDAFVDEVARTNVRQTVSAIRQGSAVLAGLEKEGKIKIVGSMYNLVGGRVDFLA